MWAAHHRNFDKQFFCQGKSILPFEWMVCVRYRRYRSLDKVFGMLQTSHKRLADTCWNTELFLEEKITKRERRASKTVINNYFGQRKSILPFEWMVCVKDNRRYHFFDKVFKTVQTINISQVTCQWQVSFAGHRSEGTGHQKYTKTS